jgi:hypothetical protein
MVSAKVAFMTRKRGVGIAILGDMYRKYVPSTVRIPLRRLRRKAKEFRIKGYREELLKTTYSSNTTKLIMFLTPGWNGVSGGILSETAFYEETSKIKRIHESETIMCTIPSESSLLKYTMFASHNYLFDFQDSLAYFDKLDSLMIHIPEYAVSKFLRNLTKIDYNRLIKIGNLHLNILLQNLDAFDRSVSPEDLDRLRKLGRLTCTTAHQQYSNRELRDKLGFPLHKLSVYLSPELYERTNYAEKEDLIIVSPDPHPKRTEILRLLAAQMPRLEIQIVQDLPYEKFKKLISQAKWALTFGEGLDGYFIETIFSGGISFAVYNPTFFTEDFRQLQTVYESYDALQERICTDLEQLDNKQSYASYQSIQFELCRKYYSHDDYVKNVEAFYRGDYTFK